MSAKLISTAALALALMGGAASAQLSGSTGGAGGAAGGVGGTAGAGGAGGGLGSTTGSGGAAGGVGGSSAVSPSLGSGSTPSGGGIGSGGGLSGSGLGGGVTGTGGAAGSGASTTEQRASEGSTTINSLNVDSLARDGTNGTGLSSTSGGGFGASPSAADTPSIAGAGPERLFDIPQPSVAVSPNAIRNALAAGSNATPKPDGR